jgi:hypothetical protein
MATHDIFGRCSVRLSITTPTTFIMIFFVFFSPSTQSPRSYLQFLMHYQKIVCILSGRCRRYLSYKWINKEKARRSKSEMPPSLSSLGLSIVWILGLLGGLLSFRLYTPKAWSWDTATLSFCYHCQTAWHTISCEAVSVSTYRATSLHLCVFLS